MNFSSGHVLCMYVYSEMKVIYIYIYSVVIQSSRVDEKKVRVNLSVEKYRLKKSYVNV